MDQQGHEDVIANGLTSAELKRRGIAAIEQALELGPVHLIKRNKAAAVVLTEQHYRQLQQQAAIDAELLSERDW